MSVRRSLFVMAVLVALLPMFFFNATNTPEPTSQRREITFKSMKYALAM
jgi:hypothetical protein